ncbi:MAG TPA: MFS transporter [Acidimicrobiia bacterium]|nr:MFS transporter [Acidimicrobiia bacterium]
MAEPIAGVEVPRRFSAIAPFRHSAYARLWSGAFVSNIGTWMETLALGLYVTKTTHQAAWTGTIAAASFVPIALFGPLGGALADRFPRKWLLMTTSLVQTALATVLAVLFAIGHPSPLVLTVIVFGNGICAGLGFPAFQAMLPDLVPIEDLPGAIALSSAQYNLGRVVGPALAGIVIAVGGYAAAEAVNAASFFAVIAVLITLALPKPAANARDQKLIRSIVEGFRFVRREPGLRINAAAMCLNTFLAAPFIALVPAMAVNVLHDSGGGTAILITVQGIGAVLMAFSLGALVHRFGPRHALLGLMGALPVALTAYAVAPDLALSAIALFFVGALYLGALSSFSTIAQLRAPAAIRGRALAVNTMILGSLYPLGAIVQGKVADSIGLRATTFGSAAIMAVVLVGTRLVRPGATRALDRPAEIPVEIDVG